MPRVCTICTHKSRAGQYGVSKSALVRHHDDHLPAALVKAQDATEAAQADALLAQVVDLRDKALGVLDTAQESEDLRAAIGAIREARGCVELLAKLAGQLKDAPTVNILVSSEWQGLQAVILRALEPHVEARLAVAEALTTVEYVGRA